jgi:hypothetical protein
MSKIEMPADGGGVNKGKPDGVSDSPGGANVHGRTAGGESGGGGYDNPHSGKTPTNSGFMGHGGQTVMDYSGGDQAGVNAASGAGKGEVGAAPRATPERDARQVTGEGKPFAVVETSGVAQAEATGKIGTDAAYEAEQKAPGSG